MELSSEKEKEAISAFQETINHIGNQEIDDAYYQGERKLQKFGKKVPGALSSLWSDIKAMTSMTRDYASGEYKKVPFNTIAAIASSIIYFVSPIDAIPDFIVALGYLDDASVVALCLKIVGSAVEEYKNFKGLA